MAAKKALYILGGLLILPGVFQFIGIIQLQSYRDTFMGAAIDMAINQKISFGIVLLIMGGAFVFGASRLKNKAESEH